MESFALCGYCADLSVFSHDFGVRELAVIGCADVHSGSRASPRPPYRERPAESPYLARAGPARADGHPAAAQ